MTSLNSSFAFWLHGESAHLLGLTLAHFLWEGFALALLLYTALAFCRSAQTRYRLAVLTLLAMMAAPIVTFNMLSHALLPAAPAHVTGIQTLDNAAAGANNLAANSSAPLVSIPSTLSKNWPAWCVSAWLCGVLLFGLRAMGGWLVLVRLRREHGRSLSDALVERCRILERRLGIGRRVRYLQSKAIDTPSVVGWFQPVIFFPLSAISGLSDIQLEALIAHELAHIKRLDCFVNVFQIAVETLLFYHPAVWWVNRVIRNERENCCDDVSVEICGNATEYAKALTALESARATPPWALAATGGALKARVLRLLRPNHAIAAISTGGLVFLGILCATGVLLATSAITNSDWHAAPPDETVQQPAPAPAAPETTPEPPPVPAASPTPAAAPEAVALAEPTPQSPPAPEPKTSSSDSTPASSYIEGLKAAGLTDLTIDQIIALKVQGVTPEYIREVRASGFNASVHEIIAMKVQGITPEYVKGIRDTGLNPSLHDIIGMKVQGVTPEYINAIKNAGLGAVSVHDIIGMKVQGITPEYISAVKNAGLGEVHVHDIIGMKVQNVDPEYIRAIRATGLNPTLHELIGMKVQDVTPGYIQSLKSAGFGNLHTHEIIEAKVQGITPEFIEKVRSHGFKNLTLHQLIALKNAEIF